MIEIITGCAATDIIQGKDGVCAGLNMAGIQTCYSGTFGIMNATQVAGEPFVAMGTVHTKGQNLEIHTRKKGSAFFDL